MSDPTPSSAEGAAGDPAGTVVRDFRPCDQLDACRLILDGLQERWGEAFDSAHNPDLDDLVSNYLDLGAEIVVIEVEGEIVATGALVPDDDIGQILRLSVRSDCRRQGFGRRVVEDLVARARRRAMSEVRVLTDTPWTSAVELYRTCGFADTGSDGTDSHFVMEL